MGDPAQHEAFARDVDHGLRDVEALLTIAHETAPAGHPTKGALDDPSLWQHFERGLRVGPANNFKAEVVVGGGVHQTCAVIIEAETAVSSLAGFVERSLRQDGGDVAWLIKILATETAQAITEMFLDLASGLAPPLMPERGPSWHTLMPDLPNFIVPTVEDYLMARAQSIYGGTNEIQKTIIARSVMGL